MWRPSAKVRAQVTHGQLEQALVTAHRLTTLRPNDAAAHRDVLRIMLGLQRPRTDLVTYVDGLADRLPEDVDVAVLQVDVHLAIGAREKAGELVRRAMGMPIKSAGSLDALLKALDTLGMADEAAGVVERSLADAALRSSLAVVAAERAWKSGRPADARRHIEQAQGPDAGDEALGWQAFLDVEVQPDAATPAVQRLASAAGVAAAYWRSLIHGQSALGKGDALAARDHFRAAVAARAENTVAVYLLGRAEELTGDWAAAAVRWESAVAGDTSFRIARIALVSTLLRNGRVEEARQHAIRAMVARPGAVEAYAVARAMVAAIEARRSAPADLGGVITMLEDLEKRPGMQAAVPPLLARAYIAGGRMGEAEAVTRRIIASGGGGATTEDILGLVAALQSRSPVMANELLDAARHSAPTDPDLQFAAAVREAAAGNPAAGRAILESAVAQSQGEARLYNQIQLAVFLDRTGDPAAGDMLVRLATENDRNVRAQIALLDSQAAWSNKEAVAAAVTRLRSLSGEGAQAWKVAESRRLLRFERTPANAARVVQLMADVLRLDPENTAAMALTADAMLLLDDRARAVDYLDRLLQAHPNSPAVYPILVTLLRDSGRLDEVNRRLRDFHRLQGLPPELRRQRGELLAGAGMTDEALAEFEALAADGLEIDRLNLARILVRAGDRDRAGTILEELIAVPDPSPQALIAAAELRGIQGDADAGLAILNRLPKDDPSADVSAVIANYLERHGRMPEAEDLYRRRASERGAADDWAALARFYTARGRYDAAEDAVRQGLAAAPADATLRSMQNLIGLVRGQNLPAGTLANVANVVIDEGDPAARQRFIEILSSMEANPSDRAGALVRLRRLTEQSPAFYPGWYMLVSTLLEQGNLGEAVSAVRLAARVLPTDPRSARLAVGVLTRAGELNEALDMARQWRDRSFGATIEADAAAAYLLSRLGRPRDGLAALERWRSRIESDGARAPDRLELLASLLAQTGAEAEAHRLLWDLASSDRNLAFAYLRVAEQVSGPTQLRETWIKRIEPVLLSDAEGRLELAAVWHALGSSTGAPTYLQRSVELLGDDPSVYPDPGRAALLLATAHEMFGDGQAAARFYRVALTHRPDEPTALNNLAYLLVTSGGSADEALPMARRAVEIAARSAFPDAVRASFLDTLGVIQLRLGRNDAAEQTFRDGLLLDARNPVLLLGLAEALLASGDQAGARSTVSRIDRNAPLSPGATERLAQVQKQLDAPK